MEHFRGFFLLIVIYTKLKRLVFVLQVLQSQVQCTTKGFSSVYTLAVGAVHQLIVLTVVLPSAGPVILEDPRRKLWGFNDGAVPAIIRGHLRHLDNYTDELGELIKTIL